MVYDIWKIKYPSQAPAVAHCTIPVWHGGKEKCRYRFKTLQGSSLRTVVRVYVTVLIANVTGISTNEPCRTFVCETLP